MSALDPTYSERGIVRCWSAGRFGREYFENLSSVGVKGSSRGQPHAKVNDGQPEESEQDAIPLGEHEVQYCNSLIYNKAGGGADGTLGVRKSLPIIIIGK